ncbi:MAG: RDD family protein, partial [Bacteroidetes bacterium]
MDNFKINTSQNVNLETQRAGIGDRLIAFIIDYLILSGLIIITSFVIDWSNIDNLTIIYVFTSILLFFYLFLSEIFLNGQSIGKIFRKLRVVNLKAERASIFQYLIRALLRPIDLISGLGILVVIVSKKSQRLGDLAAGTMVIRLNPTVAYSETVFTNIEENYEPVFDR